MVMFVMIVLWVVVSAMEVAGITVVVMTFVAVQTKRNGATMRGRVRFAIQMGIFFDDRF